MKQETVWVTGLRPGWLAGLLGDHVEGVGQVGVVLGGDAGDGDAAVLGQVHRVVGGQLGHL